LRRLSATRLEISIGFSKNATAKLIPFVRASHYMTLILTFSLREKELSLPLGETDAKRQ